MKQKLKVEVIHPESDSTAKKNKRERKKKIKAQKPKCSAQNASKKKVI